MSKVRIYELAKELDISSKDMLNMLAALNIEVNSHMASIDSKLADAVVKQVELARKKVYEKHRQNEDRRDGNDRNDRNKRQGDRNRGDNRGDNRGKKYSNNRNDNRGDNRGGDRRRDNKKDFRNKNGSNEEFYKRNLDDDEGNRNKRRDHKKRDKQPELEIFGPPVEKKSVPQKNKKKSRDKYKDKKYEDTDVDFFEKTRINNKKKKPKKKDKETKNEVAVIDEVVQIPESIIVSDFSEKIGTPVNLVIGKLIELGMMVAQNQPIDYETAELIATEFDVKIQPEMSNEEIINDQFELDFEDKEEDLKPRPPVVTVMGHVDHGKTSLLDSIRNAHVRTGEAGGITQHIGAYTVNINGKKIVFLDTPGHAAFTSMRARGANITDISVIVVAADDGIMPQTIEAINHSKAANVPIIVAINKIDKPTANVDRIKQELLEEGLTPEDWGGSTITVPVSAMNGQGIDELLEMILLVSEVEELKANPDRKAVGVVVEAQLDKGRGPVATVLVQKGTLNAGDEIVSGVASGRVRAMFDDKNKPIKKAGPSTPVVVLGLSDVPEAGELLYAVDDPTMARTIAGKRKEMIREEELRDRHKVSLDYLYDQIKAGELKDLNIIIKGDVRGSVEALQSSLEKISNDEVVIKTIHTGVGGINESDVMLANASGAVIIGFNVRPNLAAIDLAKELEVDIRTYKVIYEVIEDVENAVKGMLKPEIKEELLGRAEIRETFKLPNNTIVAGVYVQSGKILRNAQVRVLRDDVVIFDGNIASLKRFKDDVREVQAGYEAGMSIERFNDVKVGDVFEAYQMVEVQNG